MDEFNNQSNDNNEFGGSTQPPIQNETTNAQPSGRELTPVMALLTVEDFKRLGVVPVHYDPANRRLKLIFTSALDDDRRRELLTHLPNVEFDWHQVEENIFNAMYQQVAGEYPVNATPPTRAAENPALSGDTGPSVTTSPAKEEQPAPARPLAASEQLRQATALPGQKTVLFVTPTGNISQHLIFAFNAERCQTMAVKSLALASAELEKKAVACVFIHENLYRRKDPAIKDMQLAHPELPIRYYRSEASLLLNETRNQALFDLVRQNLTLYSHLNDSQGSTIADHGTTMAGFADRMAIHLGIPDHCRLMIATAAFLHNMAQDNLKNTAGLQPTDIIGLSASRLESWDFPPLVFKMLRRMHRPINDFEFDPEGVETMGGYILTAADVLCHLWPDYSAVGRQMDVIQRKLQEHLQQKVPPTVISTLVDVVCDDCTARLLRPNTFSVHLFEARGSLPAGLPEALLDSDFGVTVSSNIDECVKRCCDFKSDQLIIRDAGSVQDVYDTLMSLTLRGLSIDQLHTVLMLEADVVTDALRLLTHGIEDILPVTTRHEAVITKLLRIKNRLEEQNRHRVSAIERLGTHGSLADMGLTEILESVRSNRKPTRISVTAYGNQLTVYLDRGKVIAAECGDSAGTNALLMGVSWRQGIWNIEPIGLSELPEPNIDQTIDAVLIEACTKLDQAMQDEPLYSFNLTD